MSAKLERIDPARLATNPRASLSAWLRYEPIIHAAMRQHPKPYEYTPSNMAASTVCSRLRDAIRGAIAFGYSTNPTTEELTRWWAEVRITFAGNVIRIAPPSADVATALAGGTAPNGTTLSFSDLSFEELTAFHLLLSNGRIPGPVIIAHPPDPGLLPTRPNVEILPRPDGSLVLL